MNEFIVRLDGKEIARAKASILKIRFGFDKGTLSKIKDKGKIKGYEVERVKDGR